MTDLDLTADMNLSLDLTEFEPEQFAIAQAAAVQRQRQAVAYRTHSRRMARRAASDAHLAEILPLDIVPGDAWHVISQGDVDALSYLAHLLKSGPLDYVALSTWCMAQADAEQLRDWLLAGTLGRLDAYVGEIFPGQYPGEHETLCAAIRSAGGGAGLCYPKPRQAFPLPPRRAGLGRRIQRQHQHQPAHGKHRHHRRLRPLPTPQNLPRRPAQLRARLRPLDARTMTQHLGIAAIFTVVSIARSYALRRLFNRLTLGARP